MDLDHIEGEYEQAIREENENHLALGVDFALDELANFSGDQRVIEAMQEWLSDNMGGTWIITQEKV